MLVAASKSSWTASVVNKPGDKCARRVSISASHETNGPTCERQISKSFSPKHALVWIASTNVEEDPSF